MGDPAKRVGGCRGSDECVWIGRELSHPRFVAQYASLGSLAGGVDSEHRQFFPKARNVLSESLNKRAFANAWGTGNTNAHGFSCVFEDGIDKLQGKISVGG